MAAPDQVPRRQPKPATANATDGAVGCDAKAVEEFNQKAIEDAKKATDDFKKAVEEYNEKAVEDSKQARAAYLDSYEKAVLTAALTRTSSPLRRHDRHRVGQDDRRGSGPRHARAHHGVRRRCPRARVLGSPPEVRRRLPSPAQV